jgi:hypothetical protein
MKSKDIQLTLKTLTDWGRIVYSNESAFLEKFAKGDAWTLTHVSWNEDNMNIVYILGGGQHVSDGFKMSEWLDWMETKT